MAEAVLLVSMILLMMSVLEAELSLTNQRPVEFVKKSLYPDDSEEEESTAGKMPPLEDSDSAE